MVYFEATKKKVKIASEKYSKKRRKEKALTPKVTEIIYIYNNQKKQGNVAPWEKV